MSVKGQQVKQQVSEQPMLLLKGQEVQQFEQILDEMPHKYSKTIIQFFNGIQQKRQMEQQIMAKEAKPESKPESKEPVDGPQSDLPE